MPPARSRIPTSHHDEARSEVSAHIGMINSSTGKMTFSPSHQITSAAAVSSNNTTSTLNIVAEKRRHGHNGHYPPPSLEKQTSTGSVNANGAHAHEGIEGMGWDDIPITVLHNYRQAYRLPVPSASSSFRHIVLSGGIGKKTPSRARGGGRISRDALATAVRKNFNAQPIQENEVIVNFLYSVKNQDKKFRLRFPPPLGKKFNT